MIQIRGNSSKSKVTLDTQFDSIILVNTLTKDSREFSDLDSFPYGRLYFRALLDFTNLELGEYKYTAYLSGKEVQTGLLTILPFDEEEEPVQYISPEMTETVITYQN